MITYVLVIAATAFLAGALTAAFAVFFIGIRKGDRPERILGPRSSSLDTCTRAILRTGAWPNVPVYRSDRNDE